MVQPKGWREGKLGEKKYMAKSLVGKSMEKDETKLKNELKRIAEYRFGMTNTSKWGFY